MKLVMGVGVVMVVEVLVVAVVGVAVVMVVEVLVVVVGNGGSHGRGGSHGG